MARQRLSEADILPSDVTRFMAKVKAEPDSDCILWTGRVRIVKGTAYPMFDILVPRPARTVAWILAGKGDPPVQGINLTCKNSLCVNAEHMVQQQAVPNRGKGRPRDAE